MVLIRRLKLEVSYWFPAYQSLRLPEQGPVTLPWVKSSSCPSRCCRFRGPASGLVTGPSGPLPSPSCCQKCCHDFQCLVDWNWTPSTEPSGPKHHLNIMWFIIISIFLLCQEYPNINVKTNLIKCVHKHLCLKHLQVILHLQTGNKGLYKFND